MSVGECLLVLRGWSDDKREVRAVLKGDIAFAVTGTIWAVNDIGFSVEVDKENFVGATINGCLCAFLDLPPGETVVGRAVESGIVAVRQGFDLAIMLLAE